MGSGLAVSHTALYCSYHPCLVASPSAGHDGVLGEAALFTLKKINAGPCGLGNHAWNNGRGPRLPILGLSLPKILLSAWMKVQNFKAAEL